METRMTIQSPPGGLPAGGVWGSAPLEKCAVRTFNALRRTNRRAGLKKTNRRRDQKSTFDAESKGRRAKRTLAFLAARSALIT